ncbi:hypothetical protein [Paractinoplanes globisporus]|uniref:Uncharacterized protein n=1 Tax=Paractinoplanes globisporus TaxID=113565 RepID=A0ABW6WM92_9ACTN|nr:hypothetical protein [Actinoplanes globisporus]
MAVRDPENAADLAGRAVQVRPALAASGRPVTYAELPAEQFAQVLIGSGLPGLLVDVLVDADVKVAQGALQTVTGRPHRAARPPHHDPALAVSAALRP